MPRYLMTWEIDPARVPVDMNERAVLWRGMIGMTKQQMRDGNTKDWGLFVGEGRGYAVGELSPIELYKNMQKYYPFVKFETHQVMTIDEVDEALKSMEVPEAVRV